jgi:parvulin-like peptidyl-prolyl isomerase
LIPLLLASWFLVPASGFQEVLDRTLAIVGGQPVTLSDARAAMVLGLIEPEKAADPIPGIALKLVDRELILREVQRYAAAPPSESAVDARLAAIAARFADAAAMTRALDASGLSAARLRAWVRDDLKTEAYLTQRFASASTPTDAEIARYYAQVKATFDREQLTFEQATPRIREQLVVLRRGELIADWVADLRRRTEVVILPQ